MKRLSRSEFEYNHCYIRFHSVTPNNPGHYVVCQAGDKWENIRYVVEKMSGCFKFTLPLKVVQNSYLSAVYEFSSAGMPQGTPIISKTQVYGGDIIVVQRHPQPKHLHAYIPAKYWSDLGDMPDASSALSKEPTTPPESVDASEAELTEQDKLQRLFSMTAQTEPVAFLPPIVVRMLRQHILHPTDYPTLLTPHPLFVCMHCNQQGKHFHTLCPFVEADTRNNTAELVTKVRRIVGIPKSRLRAATPKEVTLGAYYLNENNEKVVVLNKEEENVPKKKKKVAAQTTKPMPPVPVFDPLEMLDMEAYESSLEFSFEEELKEQDEVEAQREEKFYQQHPELRKKKNQICTHYYRGMCHKGKLECEFLHTGDVNYIAICQFYVNGQCTMGDNCEFRHPPKHMLRNECNAYNRGFCEKGPACKYKHIKYRHPSERAELSPEDAKVMIQALFRFG